LLFGDVIVYFNSGDFRGDGRGYARYATSFIDYTGGSNEFIRLDSLDSLVACLLAAHC